MKQKRDGKKVQNWHKPPHADALKRRFVRNRDQTLDEIETEPKFDQYWNYRNPGGCLDIGELFNEQFDLNESHIHMLVRQVCVDLQSNPTPLIPREWFQELPPAEYPDIEENGDKQVNAIGLETKLKSFVGLLGNPIQAKDELYDLLTASIGDSTNLEAFESLPSYFSDLDDEYYYYLEGYNRTETKTALILFSPFWIRSPKTWDKLGGASGLIRHLFARYDAPPFLHKEWFNSDFLLRLKWILWNIQISAGGSLRKLGDVFGWRIPNRFQHFLYSVSKDEYTADATTYAEVLRLGGNRVDFDRLRRSYAFVIDTTAPSEFEGFIAFWESTVSWLISNRDEIDPAGGLYVTRECGIYISRILEWGLFRFHESRNEVGVTFSWSGRTLSGVIARYQEWEQTIIRGSRHWPRKWNQHGWDWEHAVSASEKWKIHELTSSEDLEHEGRCMQHSVAIFDCKCLNGFSSIFSVRRNGHRRLTIEVDPQSKRIVQVRGRKNRMPTKVEADVVLRWHSEAVQGKSN